MTTLTSTRNGVGTPPVPAIADEVLTAEQYFLQSIFAIPGVVDVLPPELTTYDDGVFEVRIIKSRETEYEIYGVEMETWKRFPGSRLTAMVLPHPTSPDQSPY